MSVFIKSYIKHNHSSEIIVQYHHFVLNIYYAGKGVEYNLQLKFCTPLAVSYSEGHFDLCSSFCSVDWCGDSTSWFSCFTVWCPCYPYRQGRVSRMPNKLSTELWCKWSRHSKRFRNYLGSVYTKSIQTSQSWHYSWLRLLLWH